jgi:hypothetical protein
MKITFYIEQPNKKSIKFEEATELDIYIKSKKLSSKSIIIMHNGNDKIGTITIKKYLQLEKNVK